MFLGKFIQSFARDDVHGASSSLRNNLDFQLGEDAFKNSFAAIAVEREFAGALIPVSFVTDELNLPAGRRKAS
jgi:hypothetical protein